MIKIRKISILGIIISIYLINNILCDKKGNKNYKEESEYLKLCHSHKLIKTRPTVPLKNIPKITVLIPVYNGEKFIVTALRSIQNQNFEDYEIIIIEDKSKDKSLDIINNEAEKDSRIRIIKNKKNLGTLYTKSKGINNAKGKYFLLLDQDDCFSHPDAFKTLFETAENNQADIVHFNVFSSGLEKLEIENKVKPKIINKLIYRNDLRDFLVKNICYVWFWDKMHVTNNLKKALNLFTKEKYKTHLISHEDIILNGIVASQSKSYIGINKNFYWHNTENENAVTNQKNWSDKNFLIKYIGDFCVSFQMFYEYERKYKDFTVSTGYLFYLASYSYAGIHFGLNKIEEFLNKCKSLCNFVLHIDLRNKGQKELDLIDQIKKLVCTSEIYNNPDKYKYDL